MSLQKRARKEPSPNSVRARSESTAESGRGRSAASGVSANDFTSRRRMAACEPPCRCNHPNRHVHLQNSVASLQYSTDTLFHPSSCEHYTKSAANAPRGTTWQGHPTGGPSRGALRLLRSSRYALTQPDAFGAGASRDGHSQLSHTIKRIGSAREKRMDNDFLVNCSTPFLVASPIQRELPSMR